MNATSLIRTVPGALAIAIVGSLAACDLDDILDPTRFFDPTEAAGQMEQVTDPVSPDAPHMMGIELAASYLEGAGAPALLRAPFIPELTRPLDVAGTASIPPELLGTTFVWSTDVNGYVADEGLEGAPADGVRFVYYAMSPGTQPAQPLNALGHIDIRDVSGTGNVAVAVELVETGPPLTVRASYTATAAPITGGFTANASGYVVGDRRVDFTLALTATATGGQIDYALSTDDSQLQLVTNITGGSAGTATLTFTRGGDTVVLNATITADESVSGTISYNGETIFNFAGTTASLTYTLAAGGTPSATQIAALDRIIDIVGLLFNFGELVFYPLFAVF
jgi:hypothetical protein